MKLSQPMKRVVWSSGSNGTTRLNMAAGSTSLSPNRVSSLPNAWIAGCPTNASSRARLLLGRPIATRNTPKPIGVSQQRAHVSNLRNSTGRAAGRLSLYQTLVEIGDNPRGSDRARIETASVLLDRGYEGGAEAIALAAVPPQATPIPITEQMSPERAAATETCCHSNSPGPIVGGFLFTKSAICFSRFNLFSVEDVPGTAHRGPQSRTSPSQRGHVLFDCQSHLPGTESIAQRLGLYWSPWEGDRSR
jgi:hypothetical protein